MIQRYIGWALRKKFWKMWAFWVPLVVIIVIALIVWAASGVEGKEWGMVTIATYGKGEKIQINEALLWFLGFILWMTVLSLGDRGSTTCNYPKYGR